MNWLLLDAGNTALKWELVAPALARWPGDAAAGAAGRHQGRVAIDAPELAAELARACALAGAAAPLAVIGCAVSSLERVAAIEAAVRAAGVDAVHWVRAASTFEHDGIVLHNGYRAAQQLGADRWLAMIGARARFPRPALAIINAGTATTIDGVSADGRFLGGVIAPGMDLMRAGLAQGTARLPLAQGEYVQHPDNTQDAIRTGVLDAQAGLIERRVRRIRAQAQGTVQVVLAGGNAALLASVLHGQGGFARLAHEPDVVLRGLWHVARAGARGGDSGATAP